MPHIRMILSLAITIPAWAVLGALARLDAVGPGGVFEKQRCQEPLLRGGDRLFLVGRWDAA